MTVDDEDLKAVHARVGRLEGKVEAQETKLGDVAEKVAWIKGYLQTHGNGGDVKAHMPRDAAMIVGGGGGAGGLIYVLEKLFGG